MRNGTWELEEGCAEACIGAVVPRPDLLLRVVRKDRFVRFLTNSIISALHLIRLNQ
jgi:hypothetical protein